jgi:hypothetical protein
VRTALPHTDGLVTLLNAADSSTIAVCVPDAWTAHISLDSLQVANSVLRVRRVVLHVASDLDAPSNSPQGPRPLLSTDQNALLCRMAEDRLAAAASAVPPAVSAVHRNAVMLCALRDLLTYEICAPLVLGNLWAQAGVLASSNWAPGLAVVVDGKENGSNNDCTKAAENNSHGVPASLANITDRADTAAELSAPITTTTSATPAPAPFLSTDVPQQLVLRYWSQGRHAATISISEACRPRLALTRVAAAVTSANVSSGGGSSSNNMSSAQVTKQQRQQQHGMMQTQQTPANDNGKVPLLHVVHDPPLPGVDLSDAAESLRRSQTGLNPSSLNLEALLLATVRIRIAARLELISDSLVRQTPALRVPPSYVVLEPGSPDLISLPASLSTQPPLRGPHREGLDKSASRRLAASLCVHVVADGASGVQVTVSPRSGGLRVRTYGAASLVAVPSRMSDIGLWVGDRQLETAQEEERAISFAVHAVRNRVKLDSAARAACALDIGVSDTLPPGTASVAAAAPADRAASQLVPPFAPLERHSPRRFLTLSPPPPPNNTMATSDPESNMTPLVFPISGSSTLSLPQQKSGSLRTAPKRPRLTYATTSDALVFIQESSMEGDNTAWADVRGRLANSNSTGVVRKRSRSMVFAALADDAGGVNRYDGTAAGAAAWAVTRDVVERRLRRDSLLRAFVAANVASSAQAGRFRSGETDGDMHIETASRTLLKLKCEPLPVRCAELLLRGNDAWQVRLSLLPSIFDSTNDIYASGDYSDRCIAIAANAVAGEVNRKVRKRRKRRRAFSAANIDLESLVISDPSPAIDRSEIVGWSCQLWFIPYIYIPVCQCGVGPQLFS